MDTLLKKYKYIIYIALISVINTSYATSNDLFFNTADIPIVLSASRLPQPQTEAPTSVTILDRTLIEASGATSVTEIFRLVPGMQVGYARGNFPVVAYQGLTSEFPQGVQVMIDGASVYSPLFGGVQWSLLPIELEDIEQIEIVRGPNSVSFGANAFQSVINITTTHAAQPSYSGGSFQIGNDQSERIFLRATGSFNNLDYRVSYADNKSEGYDNLNDDLKKQHISSRLDYRINKNQQLQVDFSAIDSLRQTETPFAALLIFDPKRNRNESSQFAQIKWDYQVAPDEQIKTNVSFIHNDAKDKYSIPFLANKINISSESTRWNADLEHSFRLNPSSRLVWGAGATYETVYSPFRLNTEQTKSNQRYRLFSNIETKINPHFIFNGGALIEYDDISGNQFSPRAALVYLPSVQHAFRLSSTQAFRTPVLTEEYRRSFIGTFELERSAGNLDAETIRSAELGYHGLFLNNVLNADIRYFHNKYEKLINTELPSPGLHIVNNQGSATTAGLEVEVNYRPNKSTVLHAGYAFTDISRTTTTLNDSVPKHNFNFLLSHRYKQHWQASAAYYYMSGMKYLGGQNTLQSTFQRLDLNVGKTLTFSTNNELNITLKTQIALDKNIDFHSQASPDNRIFLQIEYRAY